MSLALPLSELRYSASRTCGGADVVLRPEVVREAEPSMLPLYRPDEVAGPSAGTATSPVPPLLLWPEPRRRVILTVRPDLDDAEHTCCATWPPVEEAARCPRHSMEVPRNVLRTAGRRGQAWEAPGREAPSPPSPLCTPGVRTETGCTISASVTTLKITSTLAQGVGGQLESVSASVLFSFHAKYGKRTYCFNARTGGSGR